MCKVSFLYDYEHVHVYAIDQKDSCAFQGPDPPEAMNLRCAFSLDNTRQLTFIIEPPSAERNWDKYDVTCSCGRGPWQPVYSSGLSAVYSYVAAFLRHKILVRLLLSCALMSIRRCRIQTIVHEYCRILQS